MGLLLYPGVQMASVLGMTDLLVIADRFAREKSQGLKEPMLRVTQGRAGRATLASVCAGTFVLGETGLLAGRTVTTHWLYEDAVRKRFEKVRVDTARLIIDDGDILSAGGVMAWTDLMLKLVGRFLGGPIMMQTARAFVVDPPGRLPSRPRVEGARFSRPAIEGFFS